MRPFHTVPAFLLALALSACCDPDDPDPETPEVGSEESTDTDTDTGEFESESTDSTTETDSGESGSGSGGVAECVDEFVTCDKGGATLVCMTCLAGDRVPCSCLGPEGNAIFCYVFDASLC